MPVVFTFDIEEHHRIEAAHGYDCPADAKRDYSRRMVENTRWLLDTLASFDAKATFFVLGDIAAAHPKLIREMVAAGHEVASHGWDHQRVHHFEPRSFREDVRTSVDAIEHATGTAVIGYRAPTFSIGRQTAWAIDVLADCGMRYDSSVFPVQHDRYGVADAPRSPFMVRGVERLLLELPPLTLGLGIMNLPAAGGGYFRLFPPMIMRTAIARACRQPNSPAVLYFHPWEFDETQPRLPLRGLARFRTYVGMSRTRNRLRDLLTRYGSVRMIDAVEALEKSVEPIPTFGLVEQTPVPVPLLAQT